MNNSHSDRNLLVGVLALQFGLVTREQLIAGIRVWGIDTSQRLEDIFRQQKFVTDDGLQKIHALFEMHLQMHGGDVEKSLAALSSVTELKCDLQQLERSDLEQSLQKLAGSFSETEAFAADSNPQAALSAVAAANRFRILRPHAKGGLGEVSVALDSELNREVALKEIQPQHAYQSESRSRFLLEAQITGGLEHPGIVPVYGMGTYADGRPFYAMRFIRGDSLKDGIRTFFAQYGKASTDETEHGAIPKLPAHAYESFEFRKLLQRFIDICNAIAYAHARGVLHRDLKPGNIMLGNYGETLVVDWGLAKATGKHNDSADMSQAPLNPSTDSSAETIIGSAFGTPAYMSPEQAAGRVDLFSPATDIYCLGATLYHLLTGLPPHLGKVRSELLERIKRGEFPPPRHVNSNIPLPLSAICLRAMAREPVDRYPTALKLAEDIEHWLADEPVTAHRDSLLVVAQRWARRHRSLVTAAAVLMLTLTVAISLGLILVQAEQSRTLIQKRKAEDAEQKARLAEGREREEKRKAIVAQNTAETALEKSRKQLAASFFQLSVADAKIGRVNSEIRNLRLACEFAPPSDEMRASYHRVLADRLVAGGRNPLPPLRQQQPISSVAFSPDGTRIATVDQAGKCQLWDAQTHASLGNPIQAEGRVKSAHFSPDSKVLVTLGSVTQLWTPSTGQAMGQPLKNSVTGLRLLVFFSPDSSRLLISSGKNTTLWALPSGETIGNPIGHPEEHYVRNAALSDDAARIHTVEEKGTVARSAWALHTWDAKSGTLISTSPWTEERLLHVEFDAAGRQLATIGRELQLWDMRSEKRVGAVPLEKDVITHARFTPDGKRLLTVYSGSTNYARLWDTQNLVPGMELRFNKMSEVADVAISPCGQIAAFACEDGKTWLVDVEQGYLVSNPILQEGNVDRVVFSHDGTELVSFARPIDFISRMLVDSVAYTPHKESVAAVTVQAVNSRLLLSQSPSFSSLLEYRRTFDGTGAISTDGSLVATQHNRRTVQVWDTRTGSPLAKPIAHPRIDAVAFSPDGKRIATGGLDSRARIWDVSTGQPLCDWLLQNDQIKSLRFSPDGLQLVTMGLNKTVRVWNAATGAPVESLPRFPGSLLSADYGETGLRLTTSANHVVSIIDGRTGKSLGQPLHLRADPEYSELSEDASRIIIFSAKQWSLWDCTTGLQIGKEVGVQEFGVQRALFSPAGRRVVILANRAALILDARTGRQIGDTLLHDDTVLRTAFSPNGSSLLTSDRSGRLYVWDVLTGAPLGKWPDAGAANMSFSPDGQSVVAFGKFAPTHRYDVSNAENLLSETRVNRLWREVVTGESIDQDGNVAVLSEKAWLQRRQELEQSSEWKRYLQEFVAPRLMRRHLQIGYDAEERGNFWASQFYYRKAVQSLATQPDARQLANARLVDATALSDAKSLLESNLAYRRWKKEFPKVSASYTSQNRYDAPAIVLNDGLHQLNDLFPRMWTSDRSPNSSDWLQIEFENPQEFRCVELLFSANDPARQIEPPQLVVVEYQNGSEWLPVSVKQRQPALPQGNQWNRIDFAPVTAKQLRVVLTHKANASSAVVELAVWNSDASRLTPSE